ncbi:MAG TPA: hypothetical protein VGD80_18600, partial [Kofleriaceae bacterium]
LARHVLRCPTCKATLASLVADARRTAAEDRAIRQQRIARLLRAMGLDGVSRAFEAPTAVRARARPAKPVVHRDFDASGSGPANGSRNGRRACAGCRDE